MASLTLEEQDKIMKTKFKDLTAEQYRLLLALGPEPQTSEIISILEGVAPSDLKVKDVEKWSTVSFDDLIPQQEVPFVKTFVLDGVLYGQADMSELTMGEFTDLMEMGKDLQTNLISIMTILWRPVSDITSWNRAKIRFALALLKKSTKRRTSLALKVLDTVKYEITPYNAMESDLRYKRFKSAPSEIAHFTTLFIVAFLQTLSIDSLNSTLEMMKTSLEKATK